MASREILLNWPQKQATLRPSDLDANASAGPQYDQPEMGQTY